MKVWQYGLRHKGSGRTLERVCWIDAKIEKGATISLHGDSRRWKVLWRSLAPLDTEQINRKWPVGGLG